MTDSTPDPTTPLEAPQPSNLESPAPQGMAIPDHYIEDGKILGKYANVRELIEAVAMPGKETTPPVEQVTAPLEAPAVAPAGDPNAPVDFTIPEPGQTPGGLTDEMRRSLGAEALANGGKLKAESYTKLKDLGYPQDLVDEYLTLSIQNRQHESQRVAQALGGVDVIKQITNWVSNNLPAAERAEIQTALNRGSATEQQYMLEGLKARAGIGSSPLIGTNVGHVGVVPFMNDQEMQNAIGDKRYGKDPRYTKEVEDRTRAMLKVQGVI